MLVLVATTLVLLVSRCLSSEGEVITLGYLTGSQRRPGDRSYSRPGLTLSGALTLAVSEINSFHPIIGGRRLQFRVAETFGEERHSVLQTALLWRENVSAFVGPQETCVHEALLAAAFNLPMISYYCARRETSDKSRFPTFARTRPPDTHISKSIVSLLRTFGWRQVALFHGARLGPVAATVGATLQQYGVQLRQVASWSHTFHYGYDDNPFDKLIQDTHRDVRIYLVLGHFFEHIGIMASLETQGLLERGEYFVVGVDTHQYDIEQPRKYLTGLLREDVDPMVARAFRSYVGIVGSPAVGFDDFAVAVNKYMQMPPFNIVNAADGIGGIKKIPAEGAYLYDAVYVYARALNECLTNGENYRDGRLMFNYMKDRTYESAMGYMVRMDEKGNAEGNYTLIARKEIDGSPGEYGLFPVGMFQLPENSSDLPVLKLLYDIGWVGDGPPVDEPPCGFRNEKCVLWKIILAISGGTVALLSIVAFIGYRYWAYEQALDSLLWKIDFKEIQINEFTPTNKTTKALHVMQQPLVQTSQVSLSSHPEADFRYSTIYSQVGMYRGRLYAVKRIPHKRARVDITRKMKKELKTVRDLQHDNLNAFIGACIDPPNICIITEYCSRGSLMDILENEDVTLDNIFVASLIADLVRGMIYLHESPIKSHGDLRSCKCLVDSRWVVKIADFGLHELKVGADVSWIAADLDRECERFLWRAPELLRDPHAPPWGTAKGDVYSFSIILYEIIGRRGPYGRTALTPADIVTRVVQPEKEPFRPSLDELPDHPYDCVQDCMIDCWHEDPEYRPDFKGIRARLRPLRKGLKPNIFDNMLVMMEKYATNLEALVDERTHLLVQEKKKTEALLYEMLPRSVADQLRRGKQVQAESFESVTIYFSDIVGFTSMCADSTPFEVVDFLNDLYTCFDSIIENYDVYKVETIGDAYMVASGLPLPCPGHAAQVASMALHLLSAVRLFRIRHRPTDTLKLRIGLHSGSVCAGVVGRKMPRYCLFGDTVNTASRMESTGLPLKIHCSEACKRLLDKSERYTVQERGVIYIKGKGNMKTYWILGEVPSPTSATPIRHVRSACSSLRVAGSRKKSVHQQHAKGQTFGSCGGSNTLRVECYSNDLPSLWRKGNSCPALEALEESTRQRDELPRRTPPGNGGCQEQQPLLLADCNDHVALQLMPP
ncbi:guanylate cyclase 32E-like [Ornithodoros turicata]|uniref:guanylate cyclase 32E-like n=1 Tax=Ornithodoros turicata TaxID=34597 RepID=UPI003138D546